MPGVRSIAMKLIRTTILCKEIGEGPAPLLINFLLFILGKKLLNQNDVEFDVSIG